jgi:peptide/nickel transport system permease protein
MSNSKLAHPPKPLSQLFFKEAFTRQLLFLAQRLAFGLLVLLAIIFLTYFGLDMARGAAFGAALAQALPKTIAYLGRVLAGDLGMSTAITSDILPHAINELLPGILQKSFGLLGISLLLATVVGIILGTLAATRRQRSTMIVLVSIIGISAPSFFIALLLQLLVIRWTVAVGHTVLPVGGFGWDKHLILPALVLAARPIAQITRITYLSIRNVLAQDFVRTAHSKGLLRFQVLWRHVFRNAAVPILTTVGLSLRFSLSSLPVVEFFFGWPGIGFLLLKSISQQDDNLTLALLLSLGLFFILVNLFLETMYRFIDPRLRDIPEHIASGERQTVRTAVKELREAINAWLSEIREWISNLPTFQSLLPDLRSREKTADPTPASRSNWRQGTFNNIPFVIGSLVVTGLIIVFLFGPNLAPHSPYTTRGLQIIDGEFIVPPFAPGAEYPWGTDVLGRDILSLVLAGAQQTLILAALVVVARTIVGFVLGSLAGWWNGSWLDRTILALAEMLAAFPTLLLTMILILAIGIREGFRPFLIAMCVAGWGEIMQFVRSEVIAIRPKPFIESAVAAGAGTPRIILRHVLPNLLSALISLAALEMGAVLMLLGELGFIGIFIGGGAFAELDVGATLYHYSDVPEWGSLLSNIRPYARSYSWTAIYPTLAFFIAILGFNLFGEGVRRLVETVGTQFTRLLNRYTVIAALVVVFGVGWIRENTGSITFYRQQAAVFDGEKSLAQVRALTDPAFDGRSLGSDGLRQSAQYIADQFAAMGLQAAGRQMTYFQPRSRDYEQLTAVPQLTINDGGLPLTYQQDYSEFIGRFRNMGEAEAPIHFIAMGELTLVSTGFGRQQPLVLQEIDLSDDILMVLSPEDASLLDNLSRRGTLVVADEARDLNRHFTLSARDPAVNVFGTNRAVSQDKPELWISEEAANRLLQGTGSTVAELRRQTQNLANDEIVELTTTVTASMSVTGTLTNRFETVNVIGHLPGTNDELDSQLILVMAQYDTPPIGPDGVVYPSANDNASGVALMLETIRTMQESGYQPYKTFLFVAYSGEGQEGGNFVLPPEVTKFLEARVGFANAYDIEAVIDLRGVGGGAGNRLNIAAGGSLRLVELIENSAHQMSVRVERAGEPVDLSVLFAERSLRSGGQEAPQVGLHWSGWEETARTQDDTLEAITAENLEDAGRALSLALMIIGREIQY